MWHRKEWEWQGGDLPALSAESRTEVTPVLGTDQGWNQAGTRAGAQFWHWAAVGSHCRKRGWEAGRQSCAPPGAEPGLCIGLLLTWL